MKEFLIEKFNTFNQDTIDRFQKELVGPLPSFSTPRADSTNTVMWGYTEQGFWYGNNCQTYFFENSGTIHTVGVLLTPYHFSLYQQLHKDAPTLVLQPIEITKELTSLSYVSNLYYAKFQTPNSKYGRNIVVESLVTKKANLNEIFKRYIDGLVHLTNLLKLQGVLPYYDFFNFLCCGEHSFFMFVNTFDRYEDRNDGINLLLQTIESYFLADKTFEGVDVKELMQYAKHKFYHDVLQENLKTQLDVIKHNLPGIINGHEKDILDYIGNLCLPSKI